jgi:NAD(P)-dependent dehydrogenase (short-subunit alcohol dehydrogenase family)
MPAVRFCRKAMPHLQKSRYPRIINLSSMVAAQPGSYNPHYSAFLESAGFLRGQVAIDGDGR